MSEDKMIESSGMFNIIATTADGKEVRLKKNKKIHLALPKKKKALKGTKIFYGKGDRASNAGMNWSMDFKAQGSSGTQTTTTSTTKVPKAATKPANFKKLKKIENNTFNTIGFNIGYSNDSTADLRNRTKLYVMRPNARAKTERNLLQYIVERHKYDKFFRKIITKNNLYTAISTMGELDTLKIKFSIDAKGRLRNASAESKTMSTTGLDLCQKAFEVKKRFEMTYQHKDYGKYTLYFVKRVIPSIDFDVQTSTYTSDYFTIGSLGWINCDRFIDSNQPLIAMKVTETENPDVQYYCVFKDLNSVMPGYISKDKKYMFPNVPKGMDVTIIGIKNMKGEKPEVSITASSTAEQVKTNPYVPITPAELKVKLSTAFGETPAATAVTLATP